MVSVVCPKCRAKVSLPDRPVSKTCCPQCKTVFPVRTAPPPVPAAKETARPAPAQATEGDPILRCVQCGKPLNSNPGATKARCRHCQTVQRVPEFSEASDPAPYSPLRLMPCKIG